MIHSGTFHAQRPADEVFDLLASPERFAPLLPDFESMAMQDATHFALRTVIQVGPMSGHANLAMELREAIRPVKVGYAGEATIAGGPLRLNLRFTLTPVGDATEVAWEGEISLGGSLALMAGSLFESLGRENFARMAERLQEDLRLPLPKQAPAPAPSEPTDYEV